MNISNNIIFMALLKQILYIFRQGSDKDKRKEAAEKEERAKKVFFF